jgi:hypothetical protein
MISSHLESIGLVPRQPHVDEIGLAAVKTCMATHSGRLFDLVHIDPWAIDIGEIAHALSHINRFAGHTPYPYSVAQHSYLCAIESQERYPGRWDAAFACLLHDAAEAYTGDIIRPLKRLLAPLYRPIEERIQNEIWRRFEVPMTSELSDIVRQIDSSLAMTEAQVLMRGSESWQWGETLPARREIVKTHHEAARQIFLYWFHRLKQACDRRAG